MLLIIQITECGRTEVSRMYPLHAGVGACAQLGLGLTAPFGCGTECLVPDQSAGLGPDVGLGANISDARATVKINCSCGNLPIASWIATDLLRKVKLDFAVDELEPSVKGLAGFRFEAF